MKLNSGHEQANQFVIDKVDPYIEWLKRPESERNAEAATVVMGWFDLDCGYWYRDSYDNSGAVSTGYLIETQNPFVAFSPCTDRNATDLLLAEVGKRSANTVVRFAALLASTDPEYQEGASVAWCASHWFLLLLAPASLLTWAAIEASRSA